MTMLRSVGTMGLGFGLIAGVAHADTLADWTFESSIPATSGPFAAEIGTGAASGHHASTSTYSSPAGNGSAHSFSSNTWAAGDYYQFSTSTLGDSAISLSFDQTSSSTGTERLRARVQHRRHYLHEHCGLQSAHERYAEHRVDQFGL